MNKLNIKKLKEIIIEAKHERLWHEKFVKNFVDIREPSPLSEQQLDSMAVHLYELLREKS
jgi:dephospho-CoA kinase